MSTLNKINKCIKELENMTQEQFDAINSKKNKKEYNINNYTDRTFNIVLIGVIIK